jgi:CarboxypepD_reg-like domain
MDSKLKSYFLFYLMALASSAWAEPVLDRKIDVQFAETPLKTALDQIAAKGAFTWSYNSRIINENQKITLKAQNWTIKETLLTMLGNGYEYKANGNYLIIKKSKKADKELIGYLKDQNTGERIAGATIYDKKTLRATTTDQNGYYQLSLKKQTADIVVAKLSFRDTILQVKPLSPRFVQIGMVEVKPVAASPSFDVALELRRAGSKTHRFFAASLDLLHDLNLCDTLNRRFQASLVPMIGTNHTLSGKVANDYSLNVIAGYSKGVEKLEIGALGNFTRAYVHGVQIGGAFNLNQGESTGIQIGGAYNYAHTTDGAVQISGAINSVKQNSKKLYQVAGFANHVVAGDATVQIGGFGNLLHQGKTELQVAGAINIAEEVSTLQVAGFMNKAKTSRGLQIAIFNMTDQCDCLQIGVLNKVGKRWLPLINFGRIARKAS